MVTSASHVLPAASVALITPPVQSSSSNANGTRRPSRPKRGAAPASVAAVPVVGASSVAGALPVATVNANGATVGEDEPEEVKAACFITENMKVKDYERLRALMDHEFVTTGSS